MEADLTAASVLSAELLGIRKLLKELGVKNLEPTPPRVDNQAALKQLDGESSSKKAKHIDVRVKFVGHHTKKVVLKPEYRERAAMPADFMTKALDAPRLAELRIEIGLC
ncbi:polyprotein [Phytophthora megakarya]|uniref:Polyprotein n=1 Tax=Phytophthora megakarya TaxID=4795 RepID=A0A225UJX3_9STRA|nr:polyprotein [Phytophthora megakarya]